MKEKIKVFFENYGINLIILAFELIIGILLLINPVLFTTGTIIVAGAALIAVGIICIIRYFKNTPAKSIFHQYLALGLMLVFVGFIFILKARWFVLHFPLLTMLYGFVILLIGFEKVQWTVDLFRLHSPRWWIMAIAAAAALIFATVIIVNPFASTIALWIFIGISLIVGAVLDIAALILKNIKIKPRQPKAEKEADAAASDAVTADASGAGAADVSPDASTVDMASADASASFDASSAASDSISSSATDSSSSGIPNQ